MNPSDKIFQEALAAFNIGNISDAERLFKTALKVQPRNVKVMNLLTVVLMRMERFAEAEGFIAKAVKLNPNSDVSFYNYGLILKRLNKPKLALKQFDNALRLNAKVHETWNNRGTVFNDLEQYERAISDFDQAILLNPKYSDAICNKAKSLSKLKRYDDAFAAYDKALLIKPDLAEAWLGRGNVFTELKRYDDAVAAYDEALLIKPDLGEAWLGRGNVFAELKRYDDAVAAYDKALLIKHDLAEACLGRGNVFTELKRYDDAVAAYDKALLIKPDLAEAWLGRGNVFYEHNLIDMALENYRNAMAIKEDFIAARSAECFSELPILYEFEQEIMSRRATYEAKLRALCDYVETRGARGELMKILETQQPFYLAYQGYNNRELQRLYGSMACRIMEYKYPQSPPMLPAKSNEKVKVGIVSSFFYLHSNWKIPIKGWLSQLDRDRFEIFGYHTGTTRDAETDAAADMCDRFVQGIMSIDDWRREILTDAPHVLIYPGLFMDSISIQLAAQRLAPVQCNSWGHPDTSGIPTLDYYLSSDLMEPDNAIEHYTEHLIRLPNLSIYYESTDIEPSTTSRTELGLGSDAVIFWCGQSLYKYLPQFDQVFVRTAQLVKNPQFVFVGHEKITDFFRRRLERAFGVNGLKESDYCVFLPHLNQAEFMGAIGLCDIFLDSIGWSGCNSTLESLSHNLPIVTMQGSLMRGRHSAAMLRKMGITETVANDVDEFITIAARLANHPEERKALSQKIASNKHCLFRDRKCIEALEDFLDRAARQQPLKNMLLPVQ
jgi:protein O-GlcNAc transferase